jgi:isopenicillin-N epimerase
LAYVDDVMGSPDCDDPAAHSPLALLWSLDPDVAFLNHGSFGACPRAVLEHQASLRDRLEREPVRFMIRELEAELARARAALGAFVHADPDDIAFVPNATTGVNTVLRSLEMAPGDELLTTDHVYGACHNALQFTAERARARVVVAKVPFPVASESDVIGPILESITARTRLLLIDHVTSPTALVFPVARLVAELGSRGIDTLVDGAHAPGMLPVDVTALGAAYYTANCHKWLCAPKGAAFLHVRRDRQRGIRPLVVSHGATSLRKDRSRFRLEFDWMGTTDPTAYLSVPAAIQFLERLAPGGVRELYARNHELALAARNALARALAVKAPTPDAMIGAMASLPMPDATSAAPPDPPAIDPLQDAMMDRHHIEVPIFPWPSWPKRCVRVTAQAYNTLAQYEKLGRALAAELRAR